MSSTSVRQRRAEPSKKGVSTASATNEDSQLVALSKEAKSVVSSEWDYKVALVVITALAFLTRFWGIGHPNEVVFDEVHFGKVRLS